MPKSCSLTHSHFCLALLQLHRNHHRSCRSGKVFSKLNKRTQFITLFHLSSLNTNTAAEFNRNHLAGPSHKPTTCVVGEEPSLEDNKAEGRYHVPPPGSSPGSLCEYRPLSPARVILIRLAEIVLVSWQQVGCHIKRDQQYDVCYWRWRQKNR